MRRPLICGWLLLLLSGCATDDGVRRTWQHIDANMERYFSAHSAQCQIASQGAANDIQNAPYTGGGTTGAILQGLSTGALQAFAISNAYELCMRAKGWSVREEREQQAANDYLRIARGFFSSKSWVQLSDLSDKWIQAEPRSYLAHFYKGLASLYRNDPLEASKRFSESIRLKGDEPSTYVNRALAYIRLKQFWLAKQDYEQCTVIKPDFLVATKTCAEWKEDLLFIWGSALVGQKRWTDAIEVLNVFVSSAHGDGKSELAYALSNHDSSSNAATNEKIRRLLEDASRLGSSSGTYNLAVLYREGLHGMTVDRSRATALFLQSANAGWPSAQLFLASMYASGDGVPKDLMEAKRWLSIAESNSRATEVTRKEIQNTRVKFNLYN